MNPDALLRTGTNGPRAEQLDPTVWTRVRHGVFYPAGQWKSLHDDAKHSLLVHASVPKWSTDHVISHWSAAALHGLPIIGGWPERVHVSVLGRSRTTQHGLQVHRLSDDLPPSQTRDGIRLTTPVQTVLDLARCTALRSALAAADHALHTEMIGLDDLRQAADAIPAGARGRRMARLVAELADGRAESPLESMSRAVMFEHRLPRPDLQVRLEDGGGIFGRGDFGWPGLVGECDGDMKYGAELSPDDPSARVRAEKRREDRIRRFSDMARWGWLDAFHQSGMLRILAQKNIRPMPTQLWIT